MPKNSAKTAAVDFAAEIAGSKASLQAAQDALQIAIKEKNRLNSTLLSLKTSGAEYAQLVSVKATRDFTVRLIKYLQNESANAQTDLRTHQSAAAFHNTGQH